jgi:CHAD domain-containing protein
MPLQQPFDREPGWVTELPAGSLRERLAELLEMRRLLPWVELLRRRRMIRLLNADEKTLVRLIIEQVQFREPRADRSGELPARLQLQPIRGYARAYALANALLEQRFRLRLPERPVELEALLAAGHQPGAYSSKLDVQLEPEQRADLASKQILSRLLSTIEANVEGTRQQLDSEFLHDLRVATRRTRSALSQIKGVLPAAVVADFKQRFAWLQQITGPMRDLDVYLLDFPEMQRRLPPPLRADLQPLQARLMRRHVEAQRALTQQLDSATFERLLLDWRAFLETPAAADVTAQRDQRAATAMGDGETRSAPLPVPPMAVDQGILTQPASLPSQAAWPIKLVADQRIRKMLKRVRREGRAISDQSPPEDLHELRKSCKTLRYLMEFFQSLYPKAEIREQIKQTKLLLDHLGRFQDTAVQAQHLRDEAERDEAEHDEAKRVEDAEQRALPAATLLAMGALIGQLLEEQQRIRAIFSEIFAAFDSSENAERCRLLFAAQAPILSSSTVADDRRSDEGQ